MKSSRVLTGALIVGAVAISSMFAAAPASAATLPAGAKITVVDSLDDQFYNVSPATADSAPVGTPAPIAQEVEGIDVDDAGLGYAVATLFVDIEEPEEFGPFYYPSEGWIYKADANTGKLTDGKPVVIDTGEIDTVANECSAIDYSKGVILAVCYSYAEILSSGTTWIGTIDFTTSPSATLTPLTSFSGEGFLHFSSIATNPVNGEIWGFDNTFLYAPGVWQITLDDEYPVFVEYTYNFEVLGADFDRGGQLWLSVYQFVIPTLLANVSILDLATFDFATNQPVVVDSFSSADPYEITYPASITVWGVLAATGSSVSMAPAIAASGILLLGALLAAGTMALRRRSADV